MWCEKIHLKMSIVGLVSRPEGSNHGVKLPPGGRFPRFEHAACILVFGACAAMPMCSARRPPRARSAVGAAPVRGGRQRAWVAVMRHGHGPTGRPRRPAPRAGSIAVLPVPPRESDRQTVRGARAPPPPPGRPAGSGTSYVARRARPRLRGLAADRVTPTPR